MERCSLYPHIGGAIASTPDRTLRRYAVPNGVFVRGRIVDRADGYWVALDTRDDVVSIASLEQADRISIDDHRLRTFWVGPSQTAIK